MGLDSFAYKVKDTTEKGKMKISEVGGKEKTFRTRRTYEETEIMYLRKVNAIHNYIVENWGGGEDNCQRIYLGIDDLKQIRNLCNQVLKKCKVSQGYINAGSGGGNMSGDKQVAVLKQIVKKNKPTFAVVAKKYLCELRTGDYAIMTGYWQDKKEINIGDTTDYAELITDIKIRCDNDDKPLKDENGFTIYSYDYECVGVGGIITNQEVAEELLPTQSGFFFGSTDYDEWYLEGIKECKDQLDEAIADYEAEIANGVSEYAIDYYYQASW